VAYCAQLENKAKSMPEDSPKKSSIWLQVGSLPAIGIVVLVLFCVSAKGIDIAASLLGGSSHRPAAIYGFAAVSTFLSLWLVMAAVFAYLNVGQKKKIEVITGFYTPNSIADYFDQFWAGRDGFPRLVQNFRHATPELEPGATKALQDQFRQLFAEDFGVNVFVIPIMIFVAAGGIVLFLGYSGGLAYAVTVGSGAPPTVPPPVLPFGINFDLVTIAAIFGAYTWVASDVIVRSHQWTLNPSDLAWYALRMIVAVPLGQALALAAGGATATAATGVTVPAGIGAFAAFVGSMFSLDAITSALGTAATRFNLPMKSGTEERDDLIVKLAGVDDAKARALTMEGVTTIGQLVTIDPIRVSIRTGLPFEYILNLVNAALLWVFVGNALPSLAPLGLRGASDVLALDYDWRAADVTATALTALQQGEIALTQATAASAAAQAAVPVQPDVVANTAAAVAVAQQARDDALTAYLTAVAAGPPVPPAQAAMDTALTTGVPSGGPGLTAVGFDTIRARLRQSSYALFISRLLGQ
jgi:hypothetical protein